MLGPPAFNDYLGLHAIVSSHLRGWVHYLSAKVLDLLPYYAILRSIPNKLLGVIAMLASLLILLAMPLLDTGRVRGSQFRPLARASFWALVSLLVLLGFIGSQHAEEPYVTLGAVATGLYFGWYLVLTPVVGLVENSLSDLADPADAS